MPHNYCQFVISNILKHYLTRTKSTSNLFQSVQALLSNFERQKSNLNYSILNRRP